MNCEHKVVDALKPIMKTHGWKKSRHRWHKQCGETILVLDIQKSWYSNSIYINWGVYIIALGDEAKPHVASCHVESRFDHDLGHDALDFTHASEEQTQEKIRVICEFLEHKGLPFLESISSIHELRKLKIGALGKKTKEFFFTYK